RSANNSHKAINTTAVFALFELVPFWLLDSQTLLQQISTASASFKQHCLEYKQSHMHVAPLETSFNDIASSGDGPAAPPFIVRLSSGWFAFYWFAALVLHGASIMFFGAYTWLYIVLPDTTVSLPLGMYGVIMDMKYCGVIAAFHGLIAVIHVYFVLVMLVGSMWQRRLSFHLKIGFSTSRWDSLSVPRPTRGAWLTLVKIKRWWSIGDGSFELTFMIREFVEMSLQFAQAYRMSILVPRVLLNRFYAVMLVLNAWTTPLIHVVFAHQNWRLKRMLCIATDIALDFVSTVVVPTQLARGYVHQYDPVATDFPMELWYNTMWLVNALSEFQLVFISTTADLVLRLIFSLNLILSVRVIRNAIQVKLSTLPKPSRRLERRRSYGGLQKMSRWQHHFVVAGHLIFVAWGVLALSLHLQATSQRALPECILQPWFSSKPACSLLELNCVKHPTPHGTAQEWTHMLDQIDVQSVACVSIRHCDHVEMPSALQSLNQLVGMHIYNCTIARWEQNAALTDMHMPHLIFILALQVAFAGGTLPPGLTSHDFPAMLLDIEFSKTNLTTLPEDLDEIWPFGMYLLLESSSFVELPPVLLRMEVSVLSISQNQVTQLPEGVFQQDQLTTLCVSGNTQLTSLPESATLSPALNIVFADNTSLEMLPQWLVNGEEGQMIDFYARSTPLCSALFESNTSAADEGLFRLGTTVTVHCSTEDIATPPQVLEDTEMEEFS
ncbi:TPA: LOW QUALITY PROTEIN: hypothetical protein N0F65_004759, partial [Lagenidium giganteum]